MNGLENRPGRPRVAIATHGCKLNRAESDAIGRRFLEAGYSLVDPDEKADIYVLNTCTVTHVADGKARRWLRSSHLKNPQAAVVATGCYAQRAPEDLSKVEGVSMVVGNQDKARILEAVQSLGLMDKYGSLPAFDRCRSEPGYSYPTRTRAFVKIQDGCNQFCAFCIVPFTRGREANVPIPEVVAEVKARVEEGFKEVVITGPQIGSYGLYPPNPESRRDPDEYPGRLHGLVGAILRNTGVMRLRISSIQPQDLTSKLLESWQDPRLCRHVHMALQSGSDFVLKGMGRRYSISDYQKAVERLRKAVPDIAITTDIMVGFPGETEEEFEESYRVCKGIGFAGMHVFPYSTRSETRAQKMPSKVPTQVKRERVNTMLTFARDSAARFRRSFVGRTMDVLWEETRRTGDHLLWSGLTDNYIRVYTRKQNVEPNQLTSTALLGECENGLIGDIRTRPAREERGNGMVMRKDLETTSCRS